MRTLVTTYCVLEPQVEAHAAEMFKVLSDPAIYEFENQPPESAQWLADRFRRLETRQSKDGAERWLNWVIKLTDGRLAGYVQATVLNDGVALVAYELNSRYWRKGIGSSAVTAALDELKASYGVTRFIAVLKASNFRSHALLVKLGFWHATREDAIRFRDGDDELVMSKVVL
jgi:[ribosomal protein S5]-alanine N-acetyltransferase